MRLRLQNDTTYDDGVVDKKCFCVLCLYLVQNCRFKQINAEYSSMLFSLPTGNTEGDGTADFLMCWTMCHPVSVQTDFGYQFNILKVVSVSRPDLQLISLH